MRSSDCMTIARIMAVFAEEITARHGDVTDTFHDGRRLFTRSILPYVETVRPKDRLQGGVALRATERELWLHPYVFRLVCRNGAIMAHALQTQHITGLDLQEIDEAESTVREAIGICCVEEAFTVSVQEMRASLQTEADLALNMLPALSHVSSHLGEKIFSEILDRFFKESDPTRFGLVNAITSVARDTHDPQVRWDLEELGGGVAAGKTPKPSPDHSAREAARHGREVLVG